MLLLILIVIFGLLLIDFALIGFLPKVLRIWPSLSDLDTKELIIEDTVYIKKTNIEGRFVNSMINNGVAYKSLILTPRHLIVKNTYLTYLLCINIESIKSYAIRKQVIGKRIDLHLTIENEDKFFQFKSKNVDSWIKEFSRIGIKQEGKW